MSEIKPVAFVCNDGAVIFASDQTSISEDCEPVPLYPAHALAQARADERERIINECIPGGSICDPQQVADCIRALSDAEEKR